MWYQEVWDKLWQNLCSLKLKQLTCHVRISKWVYVEAQELKSNNICNCDHARIAHRKQISPLMEKPNWNSFSEQIFKHILLLFCLQKWNKTRKTKIRKTTWKETWNSRGKTEYTCMHVHTHWWENSLPAWYTWLRSPFAASLLTGSD